MMESTQQATMVHQNEVVSMAHDLLERREYNEALAVLHKLPADDEQIRTLMFVFEQKRNQHRDRLVDQAEAARDRGDWRAAQRLITQARDLDPEGQDVRIRRLAEDITRRGAEHSAAGELERKKQRAQRLLELESKRLEDLETAIRLLQEAVSLNAEDFPSRSLLAKAQELRSEFLASQGQIATLEEAGEFEDALARVRDLIQRGWREFKGEEIFQYQAHLEAQAREFAENKAGKYLSMAAEALDSDPALALLHIEQGLNLPFVPRERLEDLENLRLKAQRARTHHEEVEQTVQEALRLINVERDFEPAIALLEGAVARLPNQTEAARHLERAREGYRSHTQQEVRISMVQARAQIRQEQTAEARAELNACLGRLEKLDGAEETAAIRQQCEALLAETERVGEVLRDAETAAGEIASLLDEGDLSAAQARLGDLDAEIRKRPELRKLRTRLARSQDLANALEQVRRALDDDDLDAAREQVRVLKRRARDHEEVKQLHEEVEASFQVRAGRAALAAGDASGARKAFKKVVSLDGPYADEAAEQLSQLGEQLEREKRERRLYRQAVQHQEAGRFEAASQTLAEIGDDASLVQRDVVRLRATIAREWRKSLAAEVRSQLKARSLEAAIETAAKLERLKMVQDTKLINEVRREFHVHRARIAMTQGQWSEAVAEWQEAQKHDPACDEIAAGLKEALKRRRVQEADATEELGRRIALLEAAFDPQAPELGVDERLADCLIVAEETGKLTSLALARINHPGEEIVTWSRSLRQLASKLKGAKEKMDLEAFSEGIGILEAALREYPDLADGVAELLRRRKKKIVETLLKRARSLDTAGESLARRIPLYRQILEIEPAHGEAREHNRLLLEDLSQLVNDLLHDCIQLKDDENVSESELDDLVVEIRSLLTVANDEQKTKLRPQLEHLQDRRRALRLLDRTIKQVRGLLNEAKETGEFTVIDRIISEASKRISARNNRFARLAKDVREIKERRGRASLLAAKVEEASEALSFDELESAAVELQRLDREDEFGTHSRLHLTDPMTDEQIPYRELVGWARQRRRNLEQLEGWLEARGPDLEELESREAELRREAAENPTTREFIPGLERLVAEHRHGADQLTTLPEAPLSPPAKSVVEEADRRRARLLARAEKLESEARRRREDDERVGDLIREVARLIEDREFGAALPLVEEGLGLAPGHVVLSHLRGVIHGYQ